MTTNTINRVDALNYKLDRDIQSAKAAKAEAAERIVESDFNRSHDLDTIIEAGARLEVANTIKAWVAIATEESKSEEEIFAYVRERATLTIMQTSNPNSTSKTHVAIANETHYAWIRATNDLLYI